MNGVIKLDKIKSAMSERNIETVDFREKLFEEGLETYDIFYLYVTGVNAVNSDFLDMYKPDVIISFYYPGNIGNAEGCNWGY